MKNVEQPVDYSKVFAALPTPHLLIRSDADLTIIEQNQAHAKLTHTTPVHTVGKPLLMVFPDTSPQYATSGMSQLTGSIRKVVRTKKPDAMSIFRYDIPNAMGVVAEHWWQTSHHPILDIHGDVTLVIQQTKDVSSDIKDREKNERIISQLHSALEIGLVSSWSWNIKKDVVHGDKNLARNFGISAKKAHDGVPLHVFIDSIHIDDRQRITNAISESVKNGKDYSAVYRTKNVKGTFLWVTARGKLQRDSFGEPIFLTGVLIDITDQKKAELRLAEREREYNALFNSTIVAIAKADTDGNIIQVNKTFLRLFGYSQAAFKRGLTSAQISFYENDKTTKSLYKTLQIYGEAEPVRKEYKRKDGSRFSGLVGAAMLPESHNTFMAFIVDVTENEQLKELNRAKDDFVALASHQLRSPTTTVKQYIGVLLNEMAGPLNEDQQQYLNTANNANNRQLTIIDDLLKTARIDTKGFAMSFKPKNIIRLVSNVISEYSGVFDSRKQHVVFLPSTTVLIVKIDAAELTACVANILENASKYSARDTTITVTITTDANHAILSVADNGVGIAKEHHGKVFEKFTRIDNELSDTTSGSGLGLYWVKRIVEIHGGHVSIQSKLGKGTTIVVRLPI